LMNERSGCRANRTYCNEMSEPGSNGILRMNAALMPIANAKSIDLLVCQQGERAISLLRENGTRSFVATHYNGKRFNSPNDLIWSPEGHLLFSDPDYGLITKVPRYLHENDTEPATDREIPFNGVYMIRKEDLADAVETGQPVPKVYLLNGEMSKPNGLAFSPDFGKLYVSNSDPKHPVYMVFDVSPDTGALSNGRIFYDATALRTPAGDGVGNGLPDGMKVDMHGNVFAAGPGGVLVISPEGVLIGRFRIDRPVSNVAFGGDGRLYATASDVITRIWIKTKPVRIISSHFKKK
jgi:gluconolactonase